MTGVVLCGGQSTRMGKDKGLLQKDSFTWAQQAANLLFALPLPVVVSVNGSQYNHYSTLKPEASLVVDKTALQLGGPLKGILSVHLERPQEDLLVLACDMPLMQVDVLTFLIQAYKQQQADACVYQKEKKAEPLCGIYTASALQQIYQQYVTGNLQKWSMHYILQQLQTVYIPVPEAWENCFDNFNSPGDLQKL